MNDPMAPLDNIKSRIFTEELDMKNYSEDLVQEIKNHLPKRIDNSMYIWKKTALEKKAGFMLISDDNEDNGNEENARQENLKILERINKRPQSAVTLNEISGDFAKDFEDPSDVTFKFLAGTGKGRSKDGVLVTHNGHFKFHKSKPSKSGDRIYYHCSEKSHSGCKATAIVETKTVKIDHGEEVQRRLVSISSYEVIITIKITLVLRYVNVKFTHFQHHTQYHTPDPAAIIAQEIMDALKEAVEKDPSASQSSSYILLNKIFNT